MYIIYEWYCPFVCKNNVYVLCDNFVIIYLVILYDLQLGYACHLVGLSVCLSIMSICSGLKRPWQNGILNAGKSGQLAGEVSNTGIKIKLSANSSRIVEKKNIQIAAVFILFCAPISILILIGQKQCKIVINSAAYWQNLVLTIVRRLKALYILDFSIHRWCHYFTH